MGLDSFNYEEFFAIRQFLGQNPVTWISLMEDDIEELEIPFQKQVSYACQFLSGSTHGWFKKNLYKLCMMNWGDFSSIVLGEFGKSVEDEESFISDADTIEEELANGDEINDSVTESMDEQRKEKEAAPRYLVVSKSPGILCNNLIEESQNASLDVVESRNDVLVNNKLCHVFHAHQLFDEMLKRAGRFGRVGIVVTNVLGYFLTYGIRIGALESNTVSFDPGIECIMTSIMEPGDTTLHVLSNYYSTSVESVCAVKSLSEVSPLRHAQEHHLIFSKPKIIDVSSAWKINIVHAQCCLDRAVAVHILVHRILFELSSVVASFIHDRDTKIVRGCCLCHSHQLSGIMLDRSTSDCGRQVTAAMAETYTWFCMIVITNKEKVWRNFLSCYIKYTDTGSRVNKIDWKFQSEKYSISEPGDKTKPALYISSVVCEDLSHQAVESNGKSLPSIVFKGLVVSPRIKESIRTRKVSDTISLIRSLTVQSGIGYLTVHTLQIFSKSGCSVFNIVDIVSSNAPHTSADRMQIYASLGYVQEYWQRAGIMTMWLYDPGIYIIQIAFLYGIFHTQLQNQVKYEFCGKSVAPEFRPHDGLHVRNPAPPVAFVMDRHSLAAAEIDFRTVYKIGWVKNVENNAFTGARAHEIIYLYNPNYDSVVPIYTEGHFDCFSGGFTATVQARILDNMVPLHLMFFDTTHAIMINSGNASVSEVICHHRLEDYTILEIQYGWVVVSALSVTNTEVKYKGTSELRIICLVTESVEIALVISSLWSPELQLPILVHVICSLCFILVIHGSKCLQPWTDIKNPINVAYIQPYTLKDVEIHVMFVVFVFYRRKYLHMKRNKHLSAFTTASLFSATSIYSETTSTRSEANECLEALSEEATSLYFSQYLYFISEQLLVKFLIGFILLQIEVVWHQQPECTSHKYSMAAPSSFFHKSYGLQAAGSHCITSSKGRFLLIQSSFEMVLAWGNCFMLNGRQIIVVEIYPPTTSMDNVASLWLTEGSSPYVIHATKGLQDADTWIIFKKMKFIITKKITRVKYVSESLMKNECMNGPNDLLINAPAYIWLFDPGIEYFPCIIPKKGNYVAIFSPTLLYKYGSMFRTYTTSAVNTFQGQKFSYLHGQVEVWIVLGLGAVYSSNSIPTLAPTLQSFHMADFLRFSAAFSLSAMFLVSERVTIWQIAWGITGFSAVGSFGDTKSTGILLWCTRLLVCRCCQDFTWVGHLMLLPFLQRRSLCIHTAILLRWPIHQ